MKDKLTEEEIKKLKDKKQALKSNEPFDSSRLDELKVLVVINTTNLLDSHGDVHLPGIWNKSLKENKMIMHLQEHEMEFSKIISDGDKLKASLLSGAFLFYCVDSSTPTSSLFSLIYNINFYSDK